MKQGKVYCDETYAGILKEDESGFSFVYDDSYFNNERARSISLTLPKYQKEYQSNILFPFFDGLIPEGWLLELALTKFNIDRKDRKSLLLKLGNDVIGNVRIEEING